ncbi:MAG: prephenate dehydrogenase/arogenate dehydrogenase family protein [Planctomycetaceae bacterium]|jgi:prephenate dehydrogenase|nr:prephenate dehydrogenase/arogenate dehydrogenase family protein [Planctomycetaceae bacterium]
MFSRLVIIGVGLLGGSIGLAAKKYGLAQTVVGVGRTQKTLDIALRNGIIDQSYLLLEAVPPPTLHDQILVVVCTPVADITRNILAAIQHFGYSEHLLLTDVGSTKTKQVQEISDLRFIGSHPIAGSERNGPDAADAELFQNRLTVLTPTKYHPADNITLLRRFWETLGSHVIEIDAAKHDEILAVTSHLPHVLSVILTQTVQEDERPFTGTGFAGMTRLAAGSPEIWRDILVDNSDPLLNALHRFNSQLQKLMIALQKKDTKTIEQLLHNAKSVLVES